MKGKMKLMGKKALLNHIQELESKVVKVEGQHSEDTSKSAEEVPTLEEILDLPYKEQLKWAKNLGIKYTKTPSKKELKELLTEKLK